MTTLYKVLNDKLVPVSRRTLASEDQLERWITDDPSIVGLDILVIGRQVTTDFGGRIDILGIDREGDLFVIELKRGMTPRDVVAQTLDYASWVHNLTTRRVHEIALSRLGKRLEEAFRERFDSPLPETLNGNHSMVIVASELDASSKRIVEYLAEEHGVSINTAFFNVFEENGEQLLATDWLMDQQEVVERSESKTKLPWSGEYYVNAGHGVGYREWEDMRKYGFISAGYKAFFSRRLYQLKEGDAIYVYQKGYGYIGFGIVRTSAVLSKDFKLADGMMINDVDLREPEILHDQEDPDISEHMVGVDWMTTLPLNEAKTFSGAFANQNVVCKLRDPATLEFLRSEFGPKDEPSEGGIA